MEPVLQNWMRQEGMDDYAWFHEWLQEGKDYPLGLKDTPKTNEETLEMEYVQKLINLSASEYAALFLCIATPVNVF
jgi:hypothetical protein